MQNNDIWFTESKYGKQSIVMDKQAIFIFNLNILSQVKTFTPISDFPGTNQSGSFLILSDLLTTGRINQNVHKFRYRYLWLLDLNLVTLTYQQLDSSA